MTWIRLFISEFPTLISLNPIANKFVKNEWFGGSFDQPDIIKVRVPRSPRLGLSFPVRLNTWAKSWTIDRESSMVPRKIATTSWAISTDLFAFNKNIKVIIPTVNSIPEDYHYVEAWFIGSDNYKSRISYLKFIKWSMIQPVSCVAGRKKKLFQPLAK